MMPFLAAQLGDEEFEMRWQLHDGGLLGENQATGAARPG